MESRARLFTVSRGGSGGTSFASPEENLNIAKQNKKSEIYSFSRPYSGGSQGYLDPPPPEKKYIKNLK